MGLQINTNVAALNSYRNLTGTQGAMQTSLERLSSGLRINRAADDAAGLAISEKLRSQVNGLNQAKANAQDGVSLIQTAEGALSETHSILQRMRTLAVQAASDTNTDSDRRQIQKEINSLTKEVQGISTRTQFNGMGLIDGSRDAKALQLQIGANAGQSMSINVKNMGVVGLSIGSVDPASSSASVGAPTFKSSAGTTVGAMTVGAYYTVKDGKVYQFADAQNGFKIATGSAATLVGIVEGNVVKAVQTAGTAAQGNATLELTFAGALQDGQTFHLASTGATGYPVDGVSALPGQNKAVSTTPSTTVTDIKAGFAGTAGATSVVSASTDKSVAAGSYEVFKKDDGTLGLKKDGQVLQNASVSTTTIMVDGKTITGDANWAEGQQFTVKNQTTVSSFSTAPTGEVKIDDGFAAGNYRIFGSATKNLQVEQADGTWKTVDGATVAAGKITVNGKSITATSGLDTANLKFTVRAPGDGSLSSPQSVGEGVSTNLDLTTADGAKAALSQIDLAIQTVSDQRADLGALQNRLDHTVKNLGVSAENLAASESRIRDTDMAQEMTAFTRSQILQQAGISMLAQANQSQQSVLKLLG